MASGSTPGGITTGCREVHPPRPRPPSIASDRMGSSRAFPVRADQGELQLSFPTHVQVSLAAPGAVERLHKEPNHAHTWLSMADGRRLVFLFPPSDSEKLYEKVADHSGALPDNFVQSVSPVDIFTPNSKRHQKFSQATGHAAVLEKGETLIIPADWWWYTAALSPSVAILHSFYNRTNRLHAAKDFGDRLARVSDPPGELPRDFREQLAELHEDIELDEED